MAVLVETSVLGRLTNAADKQHLAAADAVRKLLLRGDVLWITPQVIVEFRDFATRPQPANSLGLSAAEAEAASATFEAEFPLLPENEHIFPPGRRSSRPAG